MDVTDARAAPLPGGVSMPLLGLGTWRATGTDCYDAVRYALSVGYRHIDTATMYRNEAEVGRAVADSPVAREEVFITTKLPPERSGRERRTLDASLAALGTDYVDLWLIHWPVARRAGVSVWERFLDARRDGLARAVGVSNYDTAQIDELVVATGEAPAVNQVPWSPSDYDPRLLAEHRERGIAVEGYSPFKGTDLGHPVLAGIAADHGRSVAQVVLRWHVQHGVTAIPKSVTPARISSNFDVFDFSLTDRELARIDQIPIG